MVVVLLVGVFVVVDVLVAGFSDAHELSHIMAESKSTEVRTIAGAIKLGRGQRSRVRDH